MRILLLAVFIALPASAQEKRYAYEVELAQVAKRAQVKAGGVTWTCKGTTCTARGKGGSVSAKGCGELARKVGSIKRYASELTTLGADDLAACNAGVKNAPATKPAAKAEPKVAPRATATELTYTGAAETRE